jgi:hypothetical protein
VQNLGVASQVRISKITTCHKLCGELLVQCGRNNPPVKKGPNAYCKSFIPFCLVTERVEVLPSCTSAECGFYSDRLLPNNKAQLQKAGLYTEQEFFAYTGLTQICL